MTTTEVITDDEPVDDVLELQRITARTARLRAAKEELRAAYEYAQVLTHSTAINPEFQAYAERVKKRKINGQWKVETLPPLGDQAIYNLAVAIIYGDKMGWSPEESAMRVFSVHGKPSIEAKDAIAFITRFVELRLADGRTKPFLEGGDWIWPVEESDSRAVWKSRRNGVEVTSEWTMARAEQAGYTGNDKYQTNPTEMLRWKAAMEVARIQWMDVLRGLAYSREELELDSAPVAVVSQRVESKRGIGGLKAMLEQRRNDADVASFVSANTPVAEPVFVNAVEPEPVHAVADSPPDPVASDSQLTRVRDLLKAEKYTPNTREAMEFVSSLVTREVSKLSDLTAAEADDVIATLSTSGKDTTNG